MTGVPQGRLPLVAVLLGTDSHPFDRLVRWGSELASMGTCTCFIQHGATSMPALPPSGVDGTVMLGSTELADLLSRADCVVTHGGPGLIMEARDAGHRPIVVPRDPAFGEHVDEHQLRFASVVARAGVVVRADSQMGFELAVQAAVLRGRHPQEAGDPSAVADRFGALIERMPRPRRPRTSR